MTPGDLDTFEAARPQLRGLAYRMLGVMADADDAVQDAWLRWSTADRAAIDNPEAWLRTVTSRLAIDRLRRRNRVQNEYVGPWLPEPLIELVGAGVAGDPAAAAERSDTLTLAFLVMLEALTPDERAALLLADVFGEPFSAIAATLDRSEAACRQLASRARRKVRRDPAVAAADRVAAREVVDSFLAALAAGDESAALRCLHPDVDLVSDGGGKQRAARHPVVGSDRVARFMFGIARRARPDDVIEPATIGGLPGVVVRRVSDPPIVIGFDVRDGLIVAVRSVLNPAKLTGLEAAAAPIE